MVRWIVYLLTSVDKNMFALLSIEETNRIRPTSLGSHFETYFVLNIAKDILDAQQIFNCMVEHSFNTEE